MAEENFECEKCGREFDSKRGLSIHQTQKHSETEEEKENNDNSAENTSKQTLDLSLGLKSVAALFLMIGFFFGTTGTYLATNTGLVGEIQQDNPELPSEEADGGESAPSQATVENIDLDDRPVRGDEDAPVTLVKYEDFFCPFCGAFNNEDVAAELQANSAMPQIMEEYVETGQVKVYYKHLPVVGGEDPAIASECVAQQDHDAFWEFHDEHIDRFMELSSLSDSDPGQYEEELFDMAEQTGIDMNEFETCYNNQESQETVLSDAQEAESMGITGTPGIVIEDEFVTGAQPFNVFETIIEEQL